jgi:hypothetical protein
MVVLDQGEGDEVLRGAGGPQRIGRQGAGLDVSDDGATLANVDHLPWGQSLLVPRHSPMTWPLGVRAIVQSKLATTRGHHWVTRC